MKSRTFRHIALLVCLLSLTAGCHRQEAVPADVVDTATLVQFLTEAHIIDSYDQTIAIHHRDSLQSQVNQAYDSLYSKYGITPEQYDSSLAYYLRHPQTLESVYVHVVHNLNTIRDERLRARRSDDSLHTASRSDSLAPVNASASKRLKR